MGLPDLLMTYGNWRGRFISQRPRTVHVARELDGSLPDAGYQDAVEVVKAEIRAGADLTPRLSEDVLIAYVPNHRRKKAGREGSRDLDTMLAHDGLHHLHLGAGSGRFVPRTNEQLFLAIRDADAYLVGVYPHGSWGRMEVLERMVRNWPEAHLLGRGFSGARLEKSYSDADRWDLMEAGITVLTEVDGIVYAGLGQTVAGTPSAVTDRVNAFMWELTYLREQGLRVRLGARSLNPDLYWAPRVRNEHIGLESVEGFASFGRLA
jgi:hypothetical protein